MRDLFFIAALLGVMVGIGCGTAQAQYKAQSPNYALEYLDENSVPNNVPDSQNVQGETDLRFGEEQNEATMAKELPATNPPYVIYAALAIGLAIGVVAYLAVK